MALIATNANNTKYYIVENVSSADKDEASQAIKNGTLPSNGQVHDILAYNGEFSFDGSEAYSQEITNEEMKISSLSPAFIDYTQITDPSKHMAMHALIRPFAENDANFCKFIADDLFIHLLYVILATESQRTGLYSGAFLPLVADLTIGDVASAADFLSGFTGTSLQAATGLSTVANWQLLLDHVTAMTTPFLQKFPR